MFRSNEGQPDLFHYNRRRKGRSLELLTHSDVRQRGGGEDIIRFPSGIMIER
jgi:hypothetical protein